MAEGDYDAKAELYEYDAPSQVVDLKELQNTESDDMWFGKFAFSCRRCTLHRVMFLWRSPSVVIMVPVSARVGPNGGRQCSNRTDV